MPTARRAARPDVAASKRGPGRRAAAATTDSGDGRGARERRGRAASSQVIGDEALWYRDAIIYEVPVRAYRDSNGDGIGDFGGLTEKLDYIRDLGVTAIWVLPFYVSPLRDDGYDIADFTAVHPSYGTLRDVRRFIREAHARGLRVITELVCNHTSDQHAWFQRARRARPGTSARDFYVWSDTPDRYADARIIFTDTETSNWTWDPVAGAYYWHRFFSHQPDLNYDNPAVHDAIIRTMDFWLEMGVDGLRLDAIPYLYEREGTNCENLPETHAFLKKLRAHIDREFPGRMLLAEANQWPEDSVEYFGDGDECNMAFHFPVMPRMFMAVRMEDRLPIVDIMDQTPAIPATAQWAMFLRNHDELTLEMVTDEERDYMYRVYADEPRMRINVGIRRRLSPLLGNNRRRIELMNGLLFSLPGTPVLYYGDEIGMGDNVFVGDRNGVRTPMQWNGDRNAGFSSANRQQLYLPVVVDPEYHYEAVNVEVQQANPQSLLWWMKRLIDLRKRHPAFSRGTLEFLDPDNHRILAFIRRHEDEVILVVANLSRFVQPVELDLSAFAGHVPSELMGRVEFPAVGSGSYFLTMGPHAFMWFVLEPPAPGTEGPAPADADELPVVTGSGSVVDLLQDPGAARLVPILRDWVADRRWFRSRTRRIKALELRDVVPVPIGDDVAAVTLVEMSYVEGDPELYVVPLTIMSAPDAEPILEATPHAAVCRVRRGPAAGPDDLLIDATLDPRFMAELLGAIGARRRLRGRRGELAGHPERQFRTIVGGSGRDLPAIPIRGEQSNSSIIFGDRAILKLYRVTQPGINPDLEIGRALIERGFAQTPAIAGSIEYRPDRGPSMTAVLVNAFVPNQGNLFTYTLGELRGFFERAAAGPHRSDGGDLEPASLLEAASMAPPAEVVESTSGFLQIAHLAGLRTGELHLALADARDEAAFAPEPFSELYQRSLFQSIRGSSRQSLDLLARRLTSLPAAAAADAAVALERRGELDGRLRGLLGHKIGGMRIRTHGDLHAEQILNTGRDLVIIDFEGEPTRPLSERRLKRSPLRDVAGMLRSFHYASYGSLLRPEMGAEIRAEDAEGLDGWVRTWNRWVGAAFLAGYRERTAGAAFLPEQDADWAVLLSAFLLEKACYELAYELSNRPDWVAIPIRGILQLVGG
jgi:maltose alpha-D-glucosyltransferase/alpha-amylase